MKRRSMNPAASRRSGSGGLTRLAVLVTVIALVGFSPITPASAQEPEVTSVSIEPTDDSFVWERAPQGDFGARPKLKVGGKSAEPDRGAMRSYLRFDVPATGQTISKATLVLRAVKDSPDGGGTIYRTGTDWTEETIRYRTAPDRMGNAIAVVGAVAQREIVSIELDSVIEPGALSLELAAGIDESIKFSSKEGVRAPELVLEYAVRPALYPETSTSSILIGGAPFDVAAADMTGDGLLDLVVSVPSLPDPSVRILRGDGNGGFTQITSEGVPWNPFDLAVADVTGDGNLDVVVSSFQNRVYVLPGDGAGGIGAPVAYRFRGRPFGLVVRDVSGDDIGDIVVTVLTDDSVAVLIADGNGGFGRPKYYAVGANPFRLAVDDATGDGILDIVSVNSESRDVSILPGLGDGRFGDQTRLPAGRDPRSVAIGDVTGDGVVDIVTANSGRRSLHAGSLLAGDGAGGFEPARPIVTPGRSSAYAVSMADVTGDGALELLLAGFGTLSVLEQAEDGGLAVRSQTMLDVTGLTVADFNGDGLPDIATAGFDTGYVSIVLQLG